MWDQMSLLSRTAYKPGHRAIKSCHLKDLSFNKQFQILRTSNSKGYKIHKNIKFTCMLCYIVNEKNPFLVFLF